MLRPVREGRSDLVDLSDTPLHVLRDSTEPALRRLVDDLIERATDPAQASRRMAHNQQGNPQCSQCLPDPRPAG